MESVGAAVDWALAGMLLWVNSSAVLRLSDWNRLTLTPTPTPCVLRKEAEGIDSKEPPI